MFLAKNGEQHPICLTSKGFDVLSNYRRSICLLAWKVTLSANAAASNQSDFVAELKPPSDGTSHLVSLLSCSEDQDIIEPKTAYCEDRFQLDITSQCAGEPYLGSCRIRY